MGVLEDRHKQLAAVPGSFVIVVDERGLVAHWPRQVDALLHPAPSTPVGRPIDACLRPAAMPPEGSLIARLRSGNRWGSTYDPTLPGPHAVWVAEPVIDAGHWRGALIAVRPAHQDPPPVDEGLCARAFEVAQEALVVVDARRRVVLVNDVYRQASAQARGRPLEPGEDLLAAAAPGTEADVDEAIDAARSGAVVRRRRQVRFPNGEEFVHVVQYRGLDAAGHVSMGAITLPLASEPMASLVSRTLERGPVSLLICDASQPHLPIVYASENLERLTGYRREDVLGKNPRLFHGGRVDQPALDVVRRAISTRTGCDVVVENLRADGSAFLNRLTLFPLKDELGVVTHFAAFQQDVTELHGLRVSAQRQNLAQLTATVVGAALHDLRNVLTIATAGASLAREDVDPSSEAGLALADTVAALTRAGAMTRALLQPLHTPSATIGKTHLPRLFETVRSVSRYLLPDTVRLHVDLGRAHGFVVGDEGSLERVLVNLIVNARDAMQRRGTIWLSVERLGPARATLLVRDDGPGIPAEVQAHLFDPYVTTKPEAQGTGLGLASCRQLIEAGGGSLALETGPGGTTWRIGLERFEEEVVARVSLGAMHALQPGVPVLLVGADLSLRGALALLLRRRGALVTSVGSLDVQAARESQADLVVVDDSAAPLTALGEFLANRPRRRALILGQLPPEPSARLSSLEKPFDGEALLRALDVLATQVWEDVTKAR
jgi:PAS domain S-box-containing protein